HFDDLTRAHDAVLKARAQLDLLSPLVADLDRYDGEAATLALIGRQRDALPFYVADRTRTLLAVELASIVVELESLDARSAQLETAIATLRATEKDLGIQIAGAGGNRLTTIDEEIRRHQEEKPRREERLGLFNGLLRILEIEEISEAEQFVPARERAAARRAELDGERSVLQNELTERRVEASKLDDEVQAVNQELRSLGTRRSNLPSASLTVRDRLGAELGLPVEDLPFAGELIQVRPDAVAWEGAAERVLHSFALSLLVPDRHYEAVAAWIDGHHLGTRVVYFRVPATVAPSVRTTRRDSDSLLVDMIELKPGSGFEEWLAAELDR